MSYEEVPDWAKKTLAGVAGAMLVAVGGWQLDLFRTRPLEGYQLTDVIRRVEMLEETAVRKDSVPMSPHTRGEIDGLIRQIAENRAVIEDLQHRVDAVQQHLYGRPYPLPKR